MNGHSPQLNLTLACDGKEATLRLSGELDLASLPAALDGLEKLLEREPGKLIIDLAGLSFADSCGLKLIVRAYKALAGHPVIIRSPSRQLRTILQITGIDQLCTIEDCSSVAHNGELQRTTLTGRAAGGEGSVLGL